MAIYIWRQQSGLLPVEHSALEESNYIWDFFLQHCPEKHESAGEVLPLIRSSEKPSVCVMVSSV